MITGGESDDHFWLNPQFTYDLEQLPLGMDLSQGHSHAHVLGHLLPGQTQLSGQARPGLQHAHSAPSIPHAFAHGNTYTHSLAEDRDHAQVQAQAAVVPGVAPPTWTFPTGQVRGNNAGHEDQLLYGFQWGHDIPAAYNLAPASQATSQIYHVQPQSSATALRTHRSTSSIASMESLSGVSGLSNWSTVASEVSSEASDWNERLGDLGGLDIVGGIDTVRSCVSQSGVPIGETGRQPTQTQSLSIDPRLFQPKRRGNDEDDHAEDDIDEEEHLATARPDQSVGLPDPETFRREARRAEGKKKVSHARKQTADHIPRPRNAFILFRKHVVDAKLIPSSVETRHQNVSIITAKMWSEAPAEQKAHFNELARIEKEEHMKKYPGYRYQPVYRRTNVIRRRVRRDEAEEEKCNSVAELLLRGKSGEALETEIRDRIVGAETPDRTPSPSAPASIPLPGSSTSLSKAKSTARRGSAVALSKGALRALRAQARTQSGASSGWSDGDASLPGSRAPSPELARSHSRRPSLLATESALGYQPALDMSVEGFFAGLAYETPAALWQPVLQSEPVSLPPLPAWPSLSFSESQGNQYFYPQPLQTAGGDVTTNSGIAFVSGSMGMDTYVDNQAAVQSNDVQPAIRWQCEGEDLRYNVPKDIVFGRWTGGPSPTTAAYPARPISARWFSAASGTGSRGGDGSGSGSGGGGGDSLMMAPGVREVPLESLEPLLFDEGGIELLDFETALNQADVVGW